MMLNLIYLFLDGGDNPFAAIMDRGWTCFAYVTTEGVAVVSNTGRLITAWTKDTFNANMIEIVERPCGE